MSVPVTTRALAERLVVAATMGPTVHDVHAWRFKIVPGSIELHADPVRFRQKGDPGGRSLHLSSGAALVNLRLAAAQLGHEAVVRLLPDAERPFVLASVRLAGRHRTTRDERLLYAATLRPAGLERSASSTRPPDRLVNELGEVARLEGAALHPLPSTPGALTQRAVLTTFGDSPAEWIRAGQALQRLLLSGTIRGISTSFQVRTDFQRADLHGVEELTRPGEMPQVLVELAQTVDSRRLLKPAVSRQDEGQRHPKGVGHPL
ncbi:MAG: hypothetical protein FWJ90_23145 [Actinomadura sp.]